MGHCAIGPLLVEGFQFTIHQLLFRLPTSPALLPGKARLEASPRVKRRVRPRTTGFTMPSWVVGPKPQASPQVPQLITTSKPCGSPMDSVFPCCSPSSSTTIQSGLTWPNLRVSHSLRITWDVGTIVCSDGSDTTKRSSRCVPVRPGFRGTIRRRLGTETGGWNLATDGLFPQQQWVCSHNATRCVFLWCQPRNIS